MLRMDFGIVIGLILSLGISLVLYPVYIRCLKKLKYNQTVSEYALDAYKEKGDIPIMGGLVFVFVPLVVSVIVRPTIISNPACLIIMVSCVLYCIIGAIDDFLIIVRQNNEGLSPKRKLLLQLFFALLIFILFRDYINTNVNIPIIDVDIPLGIIYGVFMVFLYAAEANAVNFTDGMDGLSSGVSIIALIPYIIMALIDGQNDVALLLIVIMASLIAYLRYNFAPAKIFMGDSGSLAIGALFTATAIVLNRELLLVVVGGVFFIEMLCVTIQQIAVRVFHKRVFSYTPIHYAFLLKGNKEKTVVFGFYLLQAVLSIVGLIIGVLWCGI